MKWKMIPDKCEGSDFRSKPEGGVIIWPCDSKPTHIVVDDNGDILCLCHAHAIECIEQ